MKIMWIIHTYVLILSLAELDVLRGGKMDLLGLSETLFGAT